MMVSFVPSVVKKLVQGCVIAALAAFAASASEKAGPATDTPKIQLRIGSAFREPFIIQPDSGIAWGKLKQLEPSLNVEFIFVEMPAARSLVLTDHGVLDGDFLRIESIGVTYPNLVQVPYVFTVLELAAYSWRPELVINSFADLGEHAEYVVATQIGRKFLENKIRSFKNRLFVENLDQLFNLLEMKRSDIVVLDRLSAREVIGDKLGKTIFEVSSKPLAKLDLYLFLNKKHADLVPAIMKALQ